MYDKCGKISSLPKIINFIFRGKAMSDYEFMEIFLSTVDGGKLVGLPFCLADPFKLLKSPLWSCLKPQYHGWEILS